METVSGQSCSCEAGHQTGVLIHFCVCANDLSFHHKCSHLFHNEDLGMSIEIAVFRSANNQFFCIAGDVTQCITHVQQVLYP